MRRDGRVHLRDGMSRFGPVGERCVFEPNRVECRVVATGTPVLRGDVVEPLHVAAVENPRLAQAGDAPVDVYLYGRVGIGTAGVIHIDRCVGGMNPFPVLDGHGVGQVDLAHAHLNGKEFTRYINLFGTGVGVFDDFLCIHKCV